jgi:hypothetical protein
MPAAKVHAILHAMQYERLCISISAVHPGGAWWQVNFFYFFCFFSKLPLHRRVIL